MQTPSCITITSPISVSDRSYMVEGATRSSGVVSKVPSLSTATTVWLPPTGCHTASGRAVGAHRRARRGATTLCEGRANRLGRVWLSREAYGERSRPKEHEALFRDDVGLAESREPRAVSLHTTEVSGLCSSPRFCEEWDCGPPARNRTPWRQSRHAGPQGREAARGHPAWFERARRALSSCRDGDAVS